MSKTVLTAIYFPKDDIAVCQGVSHDVCVQGDDKEDCIRGIKLQIDWHNSNGTKGPQLADLPNAPEIYQTIFAECEKLDTSLETFAYGGHDIRIATATNEQHERVMVEMDTPAHRAFMEKLASYSA